MSFSCGLCSAPVVDQPAYVRHLEEVHGLIDDPGTSSEAVFEAEPEQLPPPPSAVPPLTFTPSRDPFSVLGPDERAIATVVGAVPGGADAARTAAIVAGGVLGALALQAVRGKRTPEGPGGRAMTLTTERVLLFERGELFDAVPLGEVTRAKTKGSRADRRRRVLEITAADGRKLAIEGQRQEIQGFAAVLPQFGR